LATNQIQHNAIDHRPERLHQIKHQRRSILMVGMQIATRRIVAYYGGGLSLPLDQLGDVSAPGDVSAFLKSGTNASSKHSNLHLEAIMPEGIVPSIIGAVSTVAAAVITAYREEIIDLIRGRLWANSDLKGIWDCEWQVNFPKKDESIQDSVTLTRVSGERIRGIGSTPQVGSYKLQGRLSRASLATFYYEGTGAKARTLGGVVILKLSNDWHEFKGHWHESTNAGFIGGTTVWRKRTATAL
jgi:hypothetical protein